MHVGRGCVSRHVFLESCARKGIGICFIGECWVVLARSGTQSRLDYVMLESTCRGTQVVVLMRRDLVDGVALVMASPRVVVVGVGSCRVGNVYVQCGTGVHAMRE